MPRFLTEPSFFDPLLPSSFDEIGGPDLINKKPSQASADDPESDDDFLPLSPCRQQTTKKQQW
jgi:hypothetical protein